MEESSPSQEVKTEMEEIPRKATPRGAGASFMLITSRFRHLKKVDGTAYWRSDIQFEFLCRIMLSEVRAFTLPFAIDSENIPKFSKRTREEQGLGEDAKWTFFELYLMSLIQSDRISKILKDRLLMDINYAFNFATLAFLVNIGRLNTTVNFDYEMRSQLRTFHSIPSLQVKNNIPMLSKVYTWDKMDEAAKPFEASAPPTDESSATADATPENLDQLVDNYRTSSGYTSATVKQLQDTPRLKSILKSVSNLTKNTSKYFDEFLAQVRQFDGTKTQESLNVVSLIFMLCAFESYTLNMFLKPEEICLEGQIDKKQEERRAEGGKPYSTSVLFHDIWFREEIHPEGKAQRFLWVMYNFLETNLSPEQMMLNPFNRPGSQPYVPGTDLREWYSSIIPKYTFVAPDDEIDVDTEEEKIFGEKMRRKRLQYINTTGRQEGRESTEPTEDVDMDTTADHEDSVLFPIPIAPRKALKTRPLPKKIGASANELLKDFVKEYYKIQDRKYRQKRHKRGNLQYFWATPTGTDSNFKAAEYLLRLVQEEKSDYKEYETGPDEKERLPLAPTSKYLDYGEFKRAYYRSLSDVNKRLALDFSQPSPTGFLDDIFNKL